MRANVFCTVIVLLLTVCAVAAAAVGPSFTYQGKLTDTDGQPAPDGGYQLTFVLCTNADGTGPVWTSAPATVAVKGGLFTTTITPSVTSLSSYSDLWMETRIEGTPLTPRVKLNSAPFAFRAATADTVPDGSLTYSKLSGAAARAPFLTGVKSGLPSGWRLKVRIGDVDVPEAVLAAPFTVECELSEHRPIPGVVYYLRGVVRATPLTLRRPIREGERLFQDLYDPDGDPPRTDVDLLLVDDRNRTVCTWEGTGAWVSSYMARLADDGLPVEQITLELDADCALERQLGSLGYTPEGSGVQVGFVSGQPAGSESRLQIDGQPYDALVVASDSGAAVDVWERIIIDPNGVRIAAKTPSSFQRSTSLTVRQSPCLRHDLYSWWHLVATGGTYPQYTVELRTAVGTETPIPVIRYLDAWPYSYTLKLADDGLPVEEYKIVFNSIGLAM